MALIAKAVGGFSEAPLHLGFDVFALVAAIAMYDLARRFTRRPVVATLLLVSSPIFVISAHGLMTDMPTLALSLASLALFFRGIDRGEPRNVLFSGFLAGLAVVTRYSACLVIPLFLVYALARRKRREAWPALLGASVVLTVWMAQNLAVNGALHIVASARHYRLFYAGGSFDWAGLLKKTLGDLCGLGGTSFAAALLLLATGVERRAFAFGLGVFSAAMVFVLRPAGVERLDLYSTLDVIVVAAFFGCGVVLLAEALWPQPPNPSDSTSEAADSAFLATWLLIALGGALFVLPFGTARYMLPALPPLWILLARKVEAMAGTPGRLRLAVGLTVMQGLALSAILGVADEEYAGRYRAVASSLRQSYPERTLWFVGEWGFRYYMTREGGKYLTSLDDTPQDGDIIARPMIAGMHAMSPDLRRRIVRLQDIRLQSRWPVRLMNFDGKAGYYSHHWGYLPWALSRAPLEEIEIFEVRSPAPPAPPVTCASS
jgi:4-amino-4-deoxy-L-arabinose transferase-like glycosyltransferase